MKKLLLFLLLVACFNQLKSQPNYYEPPYSYELRIYQFHHFTHGYYFDINHNYWLTIYPFNLHYWNITWLYSWPYYNQYWYSWYNPYYYSYNQYYWHYSNNYWWYNTYNLHHSHTYYNNIKPKENNTYYGPRIPRTPTNHSTYTPRPIRTYTPSTKTYEENKQYTPSRRTYESNSIKINERPTYRTRPQPKPTITPQKTQKTTTPQHRGKR